MRSKLRVVPYVLLLLPFDFIVAICLLLCSPPQLRRRQPQHDSKPEARQWNLPSATIVIVNWDGKHLLAECLPSVIEAITRAGGGHEILVVDNGSGDGSVAFVQDRFPEVHVLALDRNYGFGEGNNKGAREVRTDLIVFLNNDMVVDSGFLTPLLRPFSDASVFAVTSQIFFADPTRRREETGNTRARFEDGFFYFWHEEITSKDETLETTPVFWAGGGSCAVDRKKFLEIGGFDSLYSPFYVEDTDLSYRSWKRGWKCLLAPASRVVHKHRSTSKSKFGNRFVDTTIRKNMYLFIWKNVTDISMTLRHLANLPRTHLRSMTQNDPTFETQAFLLAVLRLPRALCRRLSSIKSSQVSDSDILMRSQKL